MRLRTLLLAAILVPPGAADRGAHAADATDPAARASHAAGVETRAADAATVDVLYAGSLVATMERGIKPAFAHATGDRFQGYAGGSNALAMQIRAHLRRADVFVSASPGVNDLLTGPANGGFVTWTVAFARSPLVIGYDPHGRFAAAFRTRPWYEVLETPGIRIGRTDPKLDPKGALTVRLLDHAEQVYHRPGLALAVLGAPENPAEIEPEETLVGRLQSGELDAGFFYSTETADLHIPAVTLPEQVALSAHYTATVLHAAPDPAAAARFVAFLIGPQGEDVLRAHGLDLVRPTLSGTAADVPPEVATAVAAADAAAAVR